MSASRVERKAPANKAPANKAPANKAPANKEAEQRKQEQSMPAPKEMPFGEMIVGIAGLILVLGIIGFLLYEAAQPQTEAEILTEVQSISPQPGGYLVGFEASNHGHQTAASVLIEGALYDPAQPDEPVETAEMTFDYIPDQSDRTASLMFEHDPREYELRLQVKGFMDP